LVTEILRINIILSGDIFLDIALSFIKCSEEMINMLSFKQPKDSHLILKGGSLLLQLAIKLTRGSGKLIVQSCSGNLPQLGKPLSLIIS